MNEIMSFVATGDSFITRRLPSKQTKDFMDLVSIISKGEVRFTNLEVTVHDFEGYAAASSGGTWAIAQPEVLADLKAYGFNLINWANNHTLDYLYGGLKATEKNLNKFGFIHAGAGENLTEASRPKYLECPSGRVALIGVTSTFHDFARAGLQRTDMRGRPGINPLRTTKYHYITKAEVKHIKMLAKILNNDLYNWSDLNVNYYQIAEHVFVEADKSATVRKLVESDVFRVIKSIEEAKRQADYILVSIHSHEVDDSDASKAPSFLSNFAKICIDEGAHSIIGHGPHILRGIEIYKNRPIFYSLGNFIFQNDTVSKLPNDFYEQYGLNFINNVADAYDAREEIYGFGEDQNVWESIIPFWSMKNGELQELILHPIELGFGMSRYKRGWPKLRNKVSILQKLQHLSKPLGTNIEIDHSFGRVIL